MLRSTFMTSILSPVVLFGCASQAVDPTAPTAPIAAAPLQAPVAGAPRVFAPPFPPDFVSARPSAFPPLPYPPTLRQQGQEGQVEVRCVVQVDGTTRNCTVLRTIGDSAFAAAALEYASHAHYRPALHKGVVVEELHRWTIDFKLNPTPLQQ